MFDVQFHHKRSVLDAMVSAKCEITFSRLYSKVKLQERAILRGNEMERLLLSDNQGRKIPVDKHVHCKFTVEELDNQQ